MSDRNHQAMRYFLGSSRFDELEAAALAALRAREQGDLVEATLGLGCSTT